MKKTIILTLLFLAKSLFCIAQTTNQETNVSIKSLSSLPGESIFVHYNTNLLFTGEQLLYKVYCFNNTNKELSKISKIAYIELVAKNESIIFKHKIRLHTGLGNGDFIIPSNLPTGSYKLFAYTQWMQNKGVESFFQADLAIINPYQKVPKAYLEQTLKHEEDISKTHQEIMVQNEDANQMLILDKMELGKRQKLTITINNEDIPDGNYSISVRKQNKLINYEPQSITTFFKGYKSSPKGGKPNTLSYLPELRGELITGTVTNKNNNLPVSGEKIALSFTGKDYLFKISTTDTDGRFYFNLDAPYNNSYVILQQLSEDIENKTVKFDKNQLDYNGLEFKSFHINPSMKEHIEERSIQNQIENAYVNLKLDNESLIEQGSVFSRGFEIIYNLDDYTRFNTIKETIVEIVNLVSIKKTADGDRIFHTISNGDFLNTELSPMLFVDGLYIENHEDFMDFSAKKIKSISFSRDKYLVGSMLFQGLLSISTIDGDYDKILNRAHQKKIELFKPQANKTYFKQDYNADKKDKWARIPDFRRQLMWFPNLAINQKEVIEMFTSDITGSYEVCLEGVSSNGIPITISKTFLVKE